MKLTAKAQGKRGVRCDSSVSGGGTVHVAGKKGSAGSVKLSGGGK